MNFPRLKDLREDHNLRQSDVAAILYCNRQTYSRYESGKRELPFSYAIILADYYNVSLDSLAGRTNKKS